MSDFVTGRVFHRTPTNVPEIIIRLFLVSCCISVQIQIMLMENHTWSQNPSAKMITLYASDLVSGVRYATVDIEDQNNHNSQSIVNSFMTVTTHFTSLTTLPAKLLNTRIVVMTINSPSISLPLASVPTRFDWNSYRYQSILLPFNFERFLVEAKLLPDHSLKAFFCFCTILMNVLNFQRK